MVAADSKMRETVLSVTKPSYVVDTLSLVSSKLALDSPAIRKYRRFFFLNDFAAKIRESWFESPMPDSGVVTRLYAHVLEAAILPADSSAGGAGCVICSRMTTN